MRKPDFAYMLFAFFVLILVLRPGKQFLHICENKSAYQGPAHFVFTTLIFSTIPLLRL